MHLRWFGQVKEIGSIVIPPLKSGLAKLAGPRLRTAIGQARGLYRIHALRKNAPEPLRKLIADAPISAMPDSLKVKRHRMYMIGADRVLHLYDPQGRPIRRGLADRLQLPPLSKLRVPKIYLHLDVEGDEYGTRTTTIWLLEEKLAGCCLDDLDEVDWRASAIEGLRQLGQLRGPPLAQSEFWQHHVEPSVAATPEALRLQVRQGWEALADLTAAPLHGDVQPKNCLSGKTLGLIDWEGFWLAGLPGLDIAFLATMAGQKKPDPARFASLLDGGDDYSTAMIDAGVPRNLYRQLLLTILAVWNLGEFKRQRRDGSEGQPRPFQDMLIRFAPKLDWRVVQELK